MLEARKHFEKPTSGFSKSRKEKRWSIPGWKRKTKTFYNFHLLTLKSAYTVKWAYFRGYPRNFILTAVRNIHISILTR